MKMKRAHLIPQSDGLYKIHLGMHLMNEERNGKTYYFENLEKEVAEKIVNETNAHADNFNSEYY